MVWQLVLSGYWEFRMGLRSCTVKQGAGALVFDVADLIKDSIILPWSFISAARGDDDKHFRMTCLNKLTEHKALDYMFEIVQRSSLKYGPGDFL